MRRATSTSQDRQRAGSEVITKDFLESGFGILRHLRPGRWHYSIQTPISDFDQYEHLGTLARIVEQMSTSALSLGADYIIKPDIVVGRWPVSDEEINREELVVSAASTIAD